MADETYLNAPGVKGDAGKLADAVHRFENAVQELRTKLGDEQGCWGDDEIGKSFEESYSPSSASELDGLDRIAHNLGQVAEQVLPQSVDALQQQDEINAEKVRAAGTEPEQSGGQ
ncbi:hypothetical protein [Saccharopolyspora rosea]|uniref:WXG100 family type VII secretion target n=1 Tax=Saccharopolyspora rosea TaxID=524884 RepID=A0ABW3FQM5_9PSEU|nr:hypothetical protein [Saccharopolyspora rosea]